MQPASRSGLENQLLQRTAPGRRCPHHDEYVIRPFDVSHPIHGLFCLDDHQRAGSRGDDHGLAADVGVGVPVELGSTPGACSATSHVAHTTTPSSRSRAISSRVQPSPDST